MHREGWVSVGTDPEGIRDAYSAGIELVRRLGPQITELHVAQQLQELGEADALALLNLVAERLPAGAVVTAVAPDLRAVFGAYLAGEIDNHTLNTGFGGSSATPGGERWWHDCTSLAAMFQRAGLTDVAPTDAEAWPLPAGTKGRAWWCAVRARVPDRGDREAAADPEVDSEAADRPPDPVDTADSTVADAGPVAGLQAELGRSRRQLARALDGELRARRRLARAEHARRDAEEEGERLRGEVRRLRDLMAGLEGSRTLWVARRASRVVAFLIPAGSVRRRLVARGVRQLRGR